MTVACIRELLLPLLGDVIVLVLLFSVSDVVLLAQAPVVGYARYDK